MSPGRRFSLQARHLLAAGLGLVAFLGMTGLALDRAFTQTALSALQERMQSYALAYLGGTDLSRSGQLILPVTAPEPRFNTSGSGLYAAVRSEAFNWESQSAVGRPVPFDMPLVLGERRFEGPLDSDEGPVYRFGLGVAWTTEADEDFDFSIVVVESAQSVEREVAVFRRALWVYLGGAGALLLLVQILISRWSLLPLRRVVGDLSKVERGQVDRLRGTYPRELALLTNNINELIEGEREHMTRYRNTLGDLAHSLKTPLAVLRARIESGNPDDAAGLREEVREQIARMDGIVAYQLARAATTGHQVFAAPIEIVPHAEALVQSLEKVYAAKNILCEFDLDSTARFYGELGDLLELLGNLLENAFKWAKHRVLLSAQTLTVAPQRRSGLLIIVEDDGPGIPPEKVELLLQRGVRGDERVQGHGIGLSIVQDIVRAYRGELAVEKSDELGGARFVLRFSPAG